MKTDEIICNPYKHTRRYKNTNIPSIRCKVSLKNLANHYFDCYCPDLMTLEDYDRLFEAIYLRMTKTGLIWKI